MSFYGFVGFRRMDSDKVLPWSREHDDLRVCWSRPFASELSICVVVHVCMMTGGAAQGGDPLRLFTTPETTSPDAVNRFTDVSAAYLPVDTPAERIQTMSPLHDGDVWPWRSEKYGKKGRQGVRNQFIVRYSCHKGVRLRIASF